MVASPKGRALDGPVNVISDDGARAKTVQALSVAEKGDWAQAEKIIKSTNDPLAQKIYHWLIFAKLDGPHDFRAISKFVRENPNWPDIYNIRLQAEQALLDNEIGAVESLEWFEDYVPKTTNGLDLYLEGLIKEGKLKKAEIILSDWWADVLLSRENQKMLFSKYRRYITREAHIKRIDTLLFARHYTNARAVAEVLGKGYSELVEARIALAEGAGGVDYLIDQVPAYLKNDPGLMFERVRWRRQRDLDFSAMELLHTMPHPEQVNNPDAWWRERHILARRLMEQGRYESAYLLVSTHRQLEGFSYAQAEWLTGFLALRFLNRPATGFQHFQTLYNKVEMPISRARAAYWAGRSADDLDQKELARYWYGKAALHQNVYYGQLAAQELHMQGRLPNLAPPAISGVDIKNFNATELIYVARLFNAAGVQRVAGEFIRAFVEQEDTPKAYRFGAELAAEFGQYHEAIRIAKKATEKGLFLTAQAYPVISDRLQNVRIEWALVHSLIRQESQFDEQARSPAGAMGLMQLMPATAHEVARRRGIKHQTAWLHSRPDHNIALGSAYLQKMLDRFNGSYPLAIAAYNAGPRRVDEWIGIFGDPRSSGVNMIDWIELIPVYETRNYVQRVLEGLYVYQLRLGESNKHMVTVAHVGTR